MKVNPYLNFGGNCEAAFRYYEKNLGGKIGMIMMHEQMPGGGEPRPDLRIAAINDQLTGQEQFFRTQITVTAMSQLRRMFNNGVLGSCVICWVTSLPCATMRMNAGVPRADVMRAGLAG